VKAVPLHQVVAELSGQGSLPFGRRSPRMAISHSVSFLETARSRTVDGSIRLVRPVTGTKARNRDSAAETT